MSREELMTGAPATIDTELEGYSEEFREKIRRFGMRKLLDGSHFGAGFKDWEAQRRDGAVLITKPGSVLDYGCANGFLLACFQEWAGIELEAFGIDTDRAAIDASRELFDDAEGTHFLATSDDLTKLPERFDYAFWNVWDNAEFEDPRIKTTLDELISRTKGGRTILGFYHPDPAVNERKLAWLSEHGYVISEVKKSENGHVFAAIDVPVGNDGVRSV